MTCAISTASTKPSLYYVGHTHQVCGVTCERDAADCQVMHACTPSVLQDLTVSTISVISQRDQDSPLNALQKVPKQHLCSHQHSPPEEEEVDRGQLSLFKQFGSLESVDLLDDEPSSQPLTDALSGSDEFLANLALETSLPQTTSALQPTSSINSLDLLGEGDAHTELFLSAGPVLLKPGKNTVRLTGLVCKYAYTLVVVLQRW